MLRWPPNYSPVMYPKNLLFVNKKEKDKYWFVCLPWNKEIKSNALCKYLNVPNKKLRFAEESQMKELLKCRPGNLNFFALMNLPYNKKISVIVDKEVAQYKNWI